MYQGFSSIFSAKARILFSNFQCVYTKNEIFLMQKPFYIVIIMDTQYFIANFGLSQIWINAMECIEVHRDKE